MKSGKKALDSYTIKGTNKVVRNEGTTTVDVVGWHSPSLSLSLSCIGSDSFVRLDGYKRTIGGHLCCRKNRGLGFGKKNNVSSSSSSSKPLTLSRTHT
ncbi:hypothetical protein Hanom_Chr05g00411021 [Helianthus anomalus]